MDNKERIARRVAMEMRDGDVVNLGIGLPTMVANYLPGGIQVVFQAENGIIGVGEKPQPEQEDPDYFNAGGTLVTVKPGGMFVDSAQSFSIIRGGHVDVTVLGALQVDQSGNLASWLVPGKKVTGMGGAMDLVVGAKQVIVAMEHTAKGNHKILEQCTFPLTAVSVVNRIITELGVMAVTDKGLELLEIAEGVSIAEMQAATGAHLIVNGAVKTMAE